MEKNHGRRLKGKGDSKSGLTRRDFLKRTGTAALVGMVSTGPFFLRGPKAYGAEATIEDLTKGKVHIGDRIAFDKVELIRHLISQATYEKMKKGQELVLDPKTDKMEIRPPLFWEVTERNRGKAMLDKNKNLWTKDGKVWPGGFPFPEPQTGLELMQDWNEKPWGGDDWFFNHDMEFLINSKGKVEREGAFNWQGIMLRGRMFVEPFGTYPGYEKERMRALAVYWEPFDIKNLGLLFIFPNDETQLNEMYGYIPALKRTRRFSAAQRDDVQAGDDVTASDNNGFNDPLSLWDYKIIEKKQMITPGYKNVRAKSKDEQRNIERWAGKFTKLKYELRPVYVIEATPIGKRAYSKKIIYFDAEVIQLLMMEGYDHTGKLWRSNEKGFAPGRVEKGGQILFFTKCSDYYDHQTDHMSNLVQGWGAQMNVGLKIGEWFDVKRLSQLGT